MKTLEGKRILVTGGTGSLGQTLVKRLLGGELGKPEISPSIRATKPNSIICGSILCTKRRQPMMLFMKTLKVC